jgi:YidC/Oxa1 family membrane protein insertase
MSEAKPRPTLNKKQLIIFLVIGVLLVLLISGTISLMGTWNLILLRPMMNGLILLSKYLLGNFGIAIIILTIILRLIMYPLTMKQLKSTKAMSAIGPKMKELQKKYGKDQQKLSQETMKLYKEEGINPLGCALPMLIQFPIWIALYQSVTQALAAVPENLYGLSKQLYSWSVIQETVPINHYFLWLDLTKGDIIMAVLVAASMWLVQKMSTQVAADPQQQSMSKIMLWVMPLMFGLMSVTLPSGLSLYWVVSNIISMVLQYRVTGWGDLKMPSLAFLKGGNLKPVDNTQAKIEGTDSTGKKADKDVALQQKGAEEDGASSEKKEAVGGDIISQRKKVRHGKYRDKRKN